jgi:uncharacterized protein (TIGR03000 family)
MYSAVLMLALTAGSESVDFGRHGCDTYSCCSVYACSTSCHRVRCHGCASSCGHRHRCYGCTTCAVSCYTVACYAPACCGTMAAPPMGAPPAKAMPMSEPVPAPKTKAQAFAPATILVSLPTGARLSVDGTPTTSTSERRTLVTPGLAVGENYVYTLRAEFVSNGQSVAQTQQVTVRGGQTSTVQFNFSSQSVASR